MNEIHLLKKSDSSTSDELVTTKVKASATKPSIYTSFCNWCLVNGISYDQPANFESEAFKLGLEWMVRVHWPYIQKRYFEKADVSIKAMYEHKSVREDVMNMFKERADKQDESISRMQGGFEVENQAVKKVLKE